jgi:hypothetical protein
MVGPRGLHAPFWNLHYRFPKNRSGQYVKVETSLRVVAGRAFVNVQGIFRDSDGVSKALRPSCGMKGREEVHGGSHHE